MVWGSHRFTSKDLGEEPWEFISKTDDLWTVYARKGEDDEPYSSHQSGYSRFCWFDVPDNIHKLCIVTNKDKHHKDPKNPSFFYYQYLDFPRPLTITKDPGPWCMPQELLNYKPPDDVIFKYFFKGTTKEVKIRQIFYHVELTEEEQEWVRVVRNYSRWRKFPLRSCIDPYLMRISYYSWRKFKDDYARQAYKHILETYSWRAQMFPLSDSDPEIMEDLAKGQMYWTARDKELRPLLIVRILKQERKPSVSRFLKTTIFCFEWAVRYLFVPGKVETCTVLFDIQSVGLSDVPLSCVGEMINALTHQYPFRLDKMFVVHDSVFISTAWACAKQFLTEVQQQKIKFYRKKELVSVVGPLFSKHQLEPRYGGTRPTITEFYPFPLLPGPFEGGAEGPNPNAVPNCWEAFTEESSIGKLWLDGRRDEFPWSDKASEVFERCGLQPPLNAAKQTDQTSSSALSSPRLGITTPKTAPPVSFDVSGDSTSPRLEQRKPVASSSDIQEENLISTSVVEAALPKEGITGGKDGSIVDAKVAGTLKPKFCKMLSQALTEESPSSSQYTDAHSLTNTKWSLKSLSTLSSSPPSSSLIFSRSTDYHFYHRTPDTLTTRNGIRFFLNPTNIDEKHYANEAASPITETTLQVSDELRFSSLSNAMVFQLSEEAERIGEILGDGFDDRFTAPLEANKKEKDEKNGDSSTEPPTKVPTEPSPLVSRDESEKKTVIKETMESSSCVPPDKENYPVEPSIQSPVTKPEPAHEPNVKQKEKDSRPPVKKRSYWCCPSSQAIESEVRSSQ